MTHDFCEFSYLFDNISSRVFIIAAARLVSWSQLAHPDFHTYSRLKRERNEYALLSAGRDGSIYENVGQFPQKDRRPCVISRMKGGAFSGCSTVSRNQPDGIKLAAHSSEAASCVVLIRMHNSRGLLLLGSDDCQ
jgi:hypothetical protein